MLNEGQRRHVSATLRVAEERLLDLQRRLDDAHSGHLLHVENDLGETERVLVAEKIADLLRQLAAAGHRLALTTGCQSLRHVVMGTLSVTWTDLQDAKTGPLSAYGDTDPRLKDVLDPLIDCVADDVMEICQALGMHKEREQR